MKKYAYIIIIYLAAHPIITPAQTLSINQIDRLIKKGHSIKTNNVDSVIILANDALRKSQSLQYQLGIANANTLASYYYFEKYKYDTARFLLNKSLRFFTEHAKHQNTIDHGLVFLHLGYIGVSEQNLSLARTYAQNALNTFKRHDQHEYILSALVLLGGIESNEGNYAKGLAYYSNALRIKTNLGYPEERFISDYSNLAAIYIRIGQYEKAIQFSKKALKLSEKHKNVEKQLINLNNLGAAYSALYQFDSALVFYEKCVDQSKINGRKEKNNIALYNISNLLYKQKKYERSFVLAKEVIALKPGIDVLLNTNILIAKNYLSLGKTDSSIALAVKLYKHHYKHSRNKESTIELTNLLATAYKAKQKYDSALYYLNINQSVSDSIYNQENQRRLNLLYAELMSIEKEKEIISLQQEALIQQKKDNSRIIFLTSSSLIIIFLSICVILVVRNKDKEEKLKNIKLTQELEKKKRDLHQQTLKIIYMNNSLIEVENSLKKVQLQDDVNESKNIELIIQIIRNSKTLDTEWKIFTEYFDQIYDQFTQKVVNRFPTLSVSEKRLILLIKMELKNREIASILNIDAASVKMAKYRLKKKLQLPEEIEIQQYLQNFN